MNTRTKSRPSRSGSHTSSNKSGRRKFSKPQSGAFKGGRGKSRFSSKKFSSNKRPSRSGFKRRGGGRKMPIFDPSQFINKNPVEAGESMYQAKNTFDTFGLNKHLVKTVHALGITTPTPIQDQIIPEILNGRDVIGLAETGTGKTAAFLLPLIEKTVKNRDRQTLILAPTRELAIQIEDELRKLAKDLRLFSVVCVGGVNINPQIRALRQRNQFIIGTPGRVLDLINRGKLKTHAITTVVLDEADRMLDMGFIHDMRTILSGTREDRETLFFSATMSKATDKLIDDFLRNPVSISVKKKDVTNSIEQDVVKHGHHDKFDTLVKLLKDHDFTRVLVFGAMKYSVEKLSRELTKNGIKAESIHGNKSHPQRQRALNKFKDGRAMVLVATDVAARGIHVNDVSHVINYDLPNTFEDYVHRIGRTGRAEKKGKALSFVHGI